MKRPLRKGIAHIHVTYQNGGFTNNLYASDFELEIEDSSVTLSMDLSGNERTRHKDSNSYHDVKEFKEDFETVKFVQLQRHDWLLPFAEAMREGKSKIRELGFRFNDGQRLTMTFQIEVSNGNLTFINSR